MARRWLLVFFILCTHVLYVTSPIIISSHYTTLVYHDEYHALYNTQSMARHHTYQTCKTFYALCISLSLFIPHFPFPHFRVQETESKPNLAEPYATASEAVEAELTPISAQHSQEDMARTKTKPPPKSSWQVPPEWLVANAGSPRTPETAKKTDAAQQAAYPTPDTPTKSKSKDDDRAQEQQTGGDDDRTQYGRWSSSGKSWVCGSFTVSSFLFLLEYYALATVPIYLRPLIVSRNRRKKLTSRALTVRKSALYPGRSTASAGYILQIWTEALVHEAEIPYASEVAYA